MCRFTLYIGPPIRLATLLTEPSHSLIRQSFRAEERSEPLNGDGFGIGWYAPRLTPDPAVYHEITPAWNSRNLHSIARVLASPCVLAHVRAASEGSTVDIANCHPFGHRQFLFMHNGSVGGFQQIRRALLDSLSDEAFGIIKGNTDTEHVFAVFIDEMVRNGPNGDGRQPASSPVDDPAAELARRLAGTIARTLAMVRSRGNGVPSYLNMAVSDGARAAACRFTNHPEAAPESLYYLQGEIYEPAGRRFQQRRADDEGIPAVVSSERLTDDPRWKVVPPNHMVVMDRYAAPRLLRMSREGLLLDQAAPDRRGPLQPGIPTAG